jgi:hypothetical protein
VLPLVAMFQHRGLKAKLKKQHLVVLLHYMIISSAHFTEEMSAVLLSSNTRFLTARTEQFTHLLLQLWRHTVNFNILTDHIQGPLQDLHKNRSERMTLAFQMHSLLLRVPNRLRSFIVYTNLLLTDLINYINTKPRRITCCLFIKLIKSINIILQGKEMRWTLYREWCQVWPYNENAT